MQESDIKNFEQFIDAGLMKYLILGDGDIGKTATALRLKLKAFAEPDGKTKGFTVHKTDLGMFWDHGGQEAWMKAGHGAAAQAGMAGLILVYDVTKSVEDTDASIKKWLGYIMNAITEAGGNLPEYTIIVANKIDLEEDAVEYDDAIMYGQNLASELEDQGVLKNVKFVAVSALTGDNFSELEGILEDNSNAHHQVYITAAKKYIAQQV